ncbi:hypothetical protein II582_00075 [bacterium]|nr:hypothetical protein [bacterium]
MEEELNKTLIERLESGFAKLDTNRLYDVFRDVLLFHLDKLRVAHIDEMQYLRDKV